MPLSHRLLSATLVFLALPLFCPEVSAQNPPAYNNQPVQPYQPPVSGAYPYAYPQAGVPLQNQYPPQQMPPQNAQYAQPPGGYQQQPQAMQGMAPYQGVPAGAISAGQWFSQYDQIRHQAQMSPIEKQKADQLMSRGLSILVPGDEKQATKALLNTLAARYQRACMELRNLPQINATSALHQGYFQYFATAGQLFNDYVRVQDNIFVTDATTGKPIAAGLLQRKQMLEGLEHQCKAMDMQTRNQLGIAPYAW